MPSPVKRVPAARKTATKASAKPSGQKSLESYISHQSLKRPAASPIATNTSAPVSDQDYVSTSLVKRQKNDAIIPSSSSPMTVNHVHHVHNNSCDVDVSTTCEDTNPHGDSVEAKSTTCSGSGTSCVTDLELQSSRSHQFLDGFRL